MLQSKIKSLVICRGGICLNIYIFPPFFSVNKTKCNTIQKYFLIALRSSKISNSVSLTSRSWRGTGCLLSYELKKLKLFGIFLTEYYD